MSRSRIAKISHKNDKVEIHIEKEENSYTTKDTYLKSYDVPELEFKTAWNELEDVVRGVLNFPEEYAKGCISVTSISISCHKECDVEGAVISGTIRLPTADSPFCFNTPHLPFEQYAENAGGKTMNPALVEKIEKLKKRAVDYYNGKRSQKDLLEQAA